MKKIIIIIISIILIINMTPPVLAYNYNLESGPDYSEALGKPTSTDDSVSSNTRRNKDAAYNPPPYGVFSGNIPTDPSNPYYDVYIVYPSTSSSSGVSYSSYESGNNPASTNYEDMLPPTSMTSPDILNMQPLYYDDGSIGTLSIPKLNLTVKVYEGETLENMRVGLGHFEFTSSWDGNVSIAGHNRGVPAAIGGIKDLKNGDRITYTTKYGTRTYEVYNKQKIADTDYSVLGWSETNILTLVTCLEGVPNFRLVVQFRQVK